MLKIIKDWGIPDPSIDRAIFFLYMAATDIKWMSSCGKYIKKNMAITYVNYTCQRNKSKMYICTADSAAALYL